MLAYAPGPNWRLPDVTLTPWSAQMGGMGPGLRSTPANGSWTGANVLLLFPIQVLEPYPVAKAFWCNGATIGTDSIDLGVYQMTDPSTGRCDLLRSTGAILSAGSANVVQEVSAWKVATKNLTSGNDSTDRSSAPGYTTASVTLKAGRLYLLSVVNTAANAAAVSAITGGPTWTSRSTTQFNGTGHRVSIWSGVPTADYTGTLDIAFGATQTGATWSLNEFSGVDTTTNDGIVQQAVGTGNSTTPLATLGAFGSANNATFGALGNVSDTTTTPGTGFTELSDSNAATPSSCLETEWRVDNDTTVDGTITSGQWGACAVEIKADASPFIIPPSRPGLPDIYMGMTVSGTTATLFRGSFGIAAAAGAGILRANATAFPLPSNITAATASSGGTSWPLAGFSLRSLLG